MTPEYAIRRPGDDGILPNVFPVQLKWMHSIVQAPDFCSEWEASHRATELALQFGYSTHQVSSPKIPRCTAHVGHAAVTFCSSVEVFLGEEDSIAMCCVSVPEEILSIAEKPWSNAHWPSNRDVHFGAFHYERDLGCPVNRLFDAFVAQFPGSCTHAFESNSLASKPADVPCGLALAGDQSVSQVDLAAKSFKFTKAPILSGNSFAPADRLVDGLSNSLPLPGLLPQVFACNELHVDPLSTSAVLISDARNRLPSTLVSEVTKSGVTHGLFQHPQSEGSGNDEPDQTNTPAPSASSRPPPTVTAPLDVPPFALDIIRSLPVEFQTNPVRIVRGVLVRSWLIHHVTFPRSLNPRQSLLRGPPHLWREQLLRVWFPDNPPQEAVSIDLVHPTPPRNWHETSVLFDVILSQGIEAGRVAALVTISPTIVHPVLRMYSTAVSLAPWISGQDLVTDADIQDLCNLHHCLIFHDQIHLPIDFNRNFHVQPGSGFVVYASSRDEELPAAAALPTEVPDPAPEPGLPDEEMPDVGEAPDDGLQADTHPSSGGQATASAVREDLARRITIYQLHRDPISAWVRLAGFSTLLQDIMEVTALSSHDIVAIHRIHSKPVGEMQHETSFIVQRQGDLPPGSSDQLILLDVLFHQHGPATLPIAPTAFDRRVLPVPFPVSRFGLLELARVSHYCEFRSHACIVLVDHLQWPLQALATRLLAHGTYVRIHIPPPQVVGVETCRTVSIVEDVSDDSAPTFEQVYPSLPTHKDSDTRAVDPEVPPPQNCMRDALGVFAEGVRTYHASDEQQTEPPVFQVPLPQQALPVLPNAPQWHEFEPGLRLSFEDFSFTEVEEEGPVLHVVTWFVHHDRHPVCLIGRLVRLSSRPWEWLQQLCNPWLPWLQPFENLAFYIVRPMPVSHLPGEQIVHIILEQGIQVGRQVALFSILFHGLHGDLTHRRAQSIPPQLSREVIERIVGIQELCAHRRCTAWVGRMTFHRQRLEPVAQALGISVTVAPYRHRFEQLDEDGYPVPDAASSSQIPPRMSFRPHDVTLFPGARWDSDVPECYPEHVPSRLIPELRVIWEHYLMTTTQPPYRFYVETWFCDHSRYPRTHRGREVQLPPDQGSWRDALLRKWQDMIDPNVEVYIYVVAPTPLGGPSDTLAHIILAQNQQRSFISALITTLAPGDSPWDPSRVALKLPTVVDKGLLVQESGLLPFCPPFMPHHSCAAFYGDQPVLQDVLRDATSGDGFPCTAEITPGAAALASDSSNHDRHISWLFDRLGKLITNVVVAVDKAIASRDQWALSLAKTVSNIDEVQSQLRHISAMHCSHAPEDDQFALLEPSVARLWSSNVHDGDFGSLHDQSIWIDPHLRRWFSQRVVEATGSSRVQVWFSDHLRPSIGFESVRVQVTASLSQGVSEIIQACAPALQSNSDLSILLVQPRGTDIGTEVDAHVLVLQNALPGLSSVLLAVHKGGSAGKQVDLVIAVVAEPVTHQHLNFALLHHPVFDFSGHTSGFDFKWAWTPIPAVGPPASHHAECIEVIPHSWQDPWVGLTDLQFAQVMQSTISSQPGVVAHGTGQPVTLSLQAVLPVAGPKQAPRSFDDRLPTISIFEHTNWKQQLADQPLPALLPLPDGFQLPSASYWAFVDDTPLDPDLPSWAEIYVDGSTSSTTASWSLVVVRTDGKASQFIGTLFGRVQLASSRDDWIGAVTVDNIAAEFSAFVIALDLACRMVPVRTVVRPDLQLSALIAAQQCVTVSNPCLAQLISVVASWLPVDASILEIRGHTGHPWNDLADGLAKWALLHEPDVFHEIPVLHQLVTASADLHWAWIQGAPNSLFHSLPLVVEEQVCQFPLSLRRVPRDVQPSLPVDDLSKCDVQVFSLNVLALDSLNDQVMHGRQNGQRTARLDLLWHQAKAHIIGLQESRTLPGQHVSEHYLIFASGFESPTAPRFGCEVWLHRSLPLVTLPDGTTVCAPAFKFAVLHADPRRLILRAEHVCCSFVVVVLHAPCLSKTKGNGHRPIDDIDQWWLETSNLLDKCPPATYQWICVDANAPLASQATPCFDLAHAEPTNPQGALFEDFLLRHELAAPATFADIHHGESWSWTHSSGVRCRRDYVLVPLSQLTCVQQSFTMTSYDGSFCHEDHIPVGIQFAAFLPSVHSQRRLLWDELAFLDPGRVSQFQDALHTLPLPTWDVRVTDHCRLYEDQVVQLGQQFFGKKHKTRFRPQLSQCTIDKIAFKRHLLDVGRAWGLMTDPEFKLELRQVEKIVRTAVYQDLACFYDQLLVQLQNADQAADAKQMFRILDRLGRKRAKQGGPRPLPLLRGPDGQAVQSFHQQQQVWLKQFAEIEAGTPLSWTALYALCRPGVSQVDVDLDPKAFVSPWQLQQAIRKLRRGKACGPNAMPPDLLKAGGPVIAMQMSCLTNKVVAHAHEPTSWRGGKLIPLYKGKGNPQDPASFRSIFISDFTAKVYHACLRKPLEQVWSAGLHSMQFGGRAGCGVDIPHHFLQMHQFWARQNKKPAAIVFFDMKSAFYSVLRQALTSCPDSNNAFSFAMRQLGLHDADIADILQAVSHENAVEGVSPHVERLVHDTMTGTFFTIEGIDTPVATHKGTRPGDPIGDLLFNLTMSRILAEMKELVLDANVASWFGDPSQCQDFSDAIELPEQGFADVSFVDDCAVAIHAADLPQLQLIAQHVVAAMHVAARRRGLHLNFEPGKTEMLWHVQGRGSKQVKMRLMQDGQLLKWQSHGVDFALRVVQVYKHLGTWLQSGGCLLKEIQTRAHGAKSAWGSLARQFFAKRYVSIATKVKVFRSLALSRHMFNVHVWSSIKPADLEKWANSIRQPLCSFAKALTKGFPPRLFDVATLGGLIGLETPQDRLHAARLRYFARLIKQCPTALWSLIWQTRTVPGSWGSMLFESFAWFCEFSGPAWKLTPEASLDQWVLAVHTDYAWKGRVRSALKKSCRYRQAKAEYAVWEKAFNRSFHADTGTTPPVIDVDAVRWQCDQCDKWFGSKKALATHSQRVHGYRRIVRFFASGDTCPACCKLHHSRMRLCQHLTYSKPCMQILQACFPPLSDEQVAELDRIDDGLTQELKKQGWWSTKALLPACQASGPLLPAADSADARMLYAHGVARSLPAGQAFMHLQGRCVDHVVDDSVTQTPQMHPAQGFVFQSDQGHLDGAGLFLRDGLPSLTMRMNLRTLVFVHFFSGYRRRQDLHEIISHLVLPDGLQIFALSVDMCIQKAAGDLTADAAVVFWREQVLSGRVFGAGGGPPCETFTSARMSGDGPRQVRSSSDITGLPYLTAREWKQVLVGTRLVQFITDILYLLARTGGCGFCEHPQYPVWCASQAPCSIWTLDPIKKMRQLQCVSVVSFDQCVLHAPIRKPTTLLLVRLWDFRDCVLRSGRGGRCAHSRGAHERLLGRDHTGQFRTARGKVYPPHMNRALGQAVGCYVERTFPSHEDHSVTPVLPEFFQRFTDTVFVAEDCVQQDYHG